MLEWEGARRFLSPFYLNALRNKMPGAWAQKEMMGSLGGTQGQTQFGDFLKNFLQGGGRGAGAGGLGSMPGGGTRGQVQQLLSAIAGGRTAAPGTPSAGTFDFWQQQPGMLSELLGQGLYGSYGDFAQRGMQRGGSPATLFAAGGGAPGRG